MVSAFFEVIFGKWASALEKLQCAVYFEQNTGLGFLGSEDELSLTEPAGFTRPCLISFRSFCIFSLFINFLNLSFSSYFFIFWNNLFKFSSSISLSSSLFLQKLFRNYFTFSRGSFHFSAFVPSQHTMSWGRPLMVLFWSKRPGP